MALAPWKRGSKYRIRYRLGNQRYDREMVAVYLGMRNTGGTSNRGERDFSGRPEFGTTTLSLSHIKDNVEVPADTPCYIDRRATHELS